MGNVLHRKILGGFGIVLGVFASSEPASAQDYLHKAVILSGRLTNGNPYVRDPSSRDYAKLQQVANLLSAGRDLEAARVITSNEQDYLESLVVQIIAPMLNAEKNPRQQTMTDTLALILGIVRDNEPFDSILYSKLRYSLNIPPSNGAPADERRNGYGRFDRARDNLLDRNVLVRHEAGVEPFTRNADPALNSSYNIPDQDVSGILSTDGWASEFARAGTERRHIPGILGILGMTIEDTRDTSVTSNYVRRDVSRVPDAFQPNLFFNFCLSCHGGMDAMADAFFNIDFDNAGNNVAGIVPRPAGNDRYRINTSNFPSGWTTTSSRWRNAFSSKINAAIGWRGAMTGVGIHSLGVAWARSSAFYSAQVERVAQYLCPNTPLDRQTLADLTRQFESDKNFRLLTERVATLQQCLGQ